jgi:hypothetical protein
MINCKARKLWDLSSLVEERLFWKRLRRKCKETIIGA